MANKVTVDDIKRINDLYYVHHNYSEVARQTGFSPSTVKKYVIKDYKPIVSEDIKRFNLQTDFPPFNPSMFRGVVNYGELCVLTEDELTELEELKSKEIEI